MLRLWQVRQGENPIWRASLESPHTGERHSFSDIAQLHAFLHSKTLSSTVEPEETMEGNE
jgi:hypothetical protein